MKSVDQLVAEHELIEQGLALLEKAIALVEAGKPVPEEFPDWITRFFRQYADQAHHAKEEDLFFPLLVERGIPKEGGPVGVMLQEHILGRDCMERMRKAFSSGSFDGALFAQAAKEYVALLRQHIFKENNILFKMAEQVMREGDDQALCDQFAMVDRQRGVDDLSDRYRAEINSWEERFP